MLIEEAIRDVPCAESKPLLEREHLVWRLREGSSANSIRGRKRVSEEMVVSLRSRGIV